MQSEVLTKSSKTLELHKILNQLSEMAECDAARERIFNLEPVYDLQYVQESLRETTGARQMILRLGEPRLSGVNNIIDSVKRCDAGSVLSMKELLDIAKVLKTARELLDYNERFPDYREGVLNAIFQSLSGNEYLEKRIFSAILTEEQMADNASPELYDIRRKLSGHNEKIRGLIQKILHSSEYQKYMQEPIMTLRDNRYVIPIKAENRNDFPGVIHDMSASGSTVFMEPKIVLEANNEIRILQNKEQIEIERILAEISADTANFADTIITDYQVIINLDFIFAKGKLSSLFNGIEPILNDKGIIDLKGVRHPLIDPKVVVPVDIRLGKDFTTLVITGPNTGGKTVTLKTLGLFTLMTMCGLHIPAREKSEISIFKYVFADIGDEQSIEQSLSTFSSHITNIVGIMDNLTPDSLVLFDELGAGTDPVEGAALAIAILDEVMLRGAKVAATTHYAELKHYALTMENVENACCEFNVETLRPTYRLLIGLPGKSNAFAISRRIGLSETIIERAKLSVNDESRKFEDIVADLQEKQRLLEEELKTAERSRYEAQRELNMAQSERKAIEKQMTGEVERKKAEAQRLLTQAKAAANSVYEEIRKIRVEQQSADFSKKIDDMRFALKNNMKILNDNLGDTISEPNEIKTDIDINKLELNMNVEIPAFGKTGVLVTLPDNSGNVMVRVGNVKLKVEAVKLRILDQPAKQKAQDVKTRNIDKRQNQGYTTSSVDKSKREARTELDLRGMSSDEAMLEVDKFIDDALVMGINSITIVHGKGTGVLRTAVSNELRKNKSVKTFRLGRYGEGESGVTIVELK